MKIVQIVGTARCGSTLLDICLGTHPDAVNVGELCRLPDLLMQGEQRCSCGEPLRACTFWNKVLARFREISPEPDISELGRLEQRLGRIRYLPLHLLGAKFREREQTRYLEMVGSLYQSLAEISDKDIVVDSSKIPARAWVATQLNKHGISNCLIHLTRDPRGYSWSANRHPHIQQPGFVRSPLDWAITNVACNAVVKAHTNGQSLTVRYEDFCRDPAKIASEIAVTVGIDPAPFEQLADSQPQINNDNHLIDGNYLRFTKRIVISLDTKWQAKLTPRQKSLVWALAGFHARKYGYRATPIHG